MKNFVCTLLVISIRNISFFKLSFFVGYILSFSLVRLWTVRLLVQVFTLARRGCDNHKCHNKNPRWKIGLGCEWRHARKRWAGNFGDFWKKQLVEIWTWAKAVQLGATGCAARLLGQLVEIGLWVGQFSCGVDWRAM